MTDTTTETRTRAITLHQPWATLTMLPTSEPDYVCRSCHGSFSLPLGMFCNDHDPRPQPVPMVKRYETRSFRAPQTIIGQRVWIHAAAKRPSLVSQWVGDWYPWSDHAPAAGWIHGIHHAEQDDKESVPLPLGALVGSAVIGEPLLMVDESAVVNGQTMPSDCITIRYDLLYRHGIGRGDITDQLPYGDWAPGRWAWPLLDPWPLAEPIPARGAQGIWFTDVPMDVQ